QFEEFDRKHPADTAARRSDLAQGRRSSRRGSGVETPVTGLIYIGAAVAEIAGCFAFWAWLKLDKSPLWLIPGLIALAAFAYLLTLVEIEAAGRAYATYGGVYIAASLVWLWLIEGMRPDRWDVTGAAICLVGAAVILLGP